jgi:hypothetical protein
MLFNALLLLAAASLGSVGVDSRTITPAAKTLNNRGYTATVSRPQASVKRSSVIATTDNVISLSKRQ